MTVTLTVTVTETVGVAVTAGVTVRDAHKAFSKTRPPDSFHETQRNHRTATNYLISST